MIVGGPRSFALCVCALTTAQVMDHWRATGSLLDTEIGEGHLDFGQLPLQKGRLSRWVQLIKNAESLGVCDCDGALPSGLQPDMSVCCCRRWWWCCWWIMVALSILISRSLALPIGETIVFAPANVRFTLILTAVYLSISVSALDQIVLYCIGAILEDLREPLCKSEIANELCMLCSVVKRRN